MTAGDIRVFYDVAETQVQVLAIVTKAEAQSWLDERGTPARRAREVALAEVKDDFSKYLRLAVDDRLEHHPAFLRRIKEARSDLRAGQGIPPRDVE